MAKLTLAGLKGLATTYVKAANQAGAWKETRDNLYKAIDKIGKQVMVDGTFNDPLTELNGDDLEFGKTVLR